MPKFTAACALALMGFSAPVWAAPQTGLPPNTINCKDFVPLPGGAWYARGDAKPFNVGETKHMTIQNSRFGPHRIVIGDTRYDLSDILDRKCGHAKGHGI